jgi:hypothetical protein
MGEEFKHGDLMGLAVCKPSNQMNGPFQGHHIDLKD